MSNGACKRTNKLCGVYSIACLFNDKQYIGSSIDIKNRWRHHRVSLVKGGHKNRFLQRAWNKYGMKAFRFNIIELCQSNTRIAEELFWVKKLKPEFNLSIPDLDREGFTWSKETRAKMSRAARGNKSSIGRVASLETRHKISKAMMGNQHAKGWVPTQEQLHKMSAAAKVRKFSKETCHKASMRMMGNQYSNGHIASEETRRKMSKSNLDRKLSDIQVLAIRERALTGENQSIIAADFGIDNATVSSIKIRRVRKWLWK